MITLMRFYAFIGVLSNLSVNFAYIHSLAAEKLTGLLGLLVRKYKRATDLAEQGMYVVYIYIYICGQQGYQGY